MDRSSGEEQRLASQEIMDVHVHTGKSSYMSHRFSHLFSPVNFFTCDIIIIPAIVQSQ